MRQIPSKAARSLRRVKPRSGGRERTPSSSVAPPDPATLDTFDRRILTALIDNSRATNVEIARVVGLSEAPCSRRIRRMEEDGIIRGYTTLLEPEAVGIGFIAYVTLVLDYVTAATADEFAEKIRAIPEIVSCYIVSGGYDAILHVAARDAKAYSDIVFDQLRRIPGVKDVRSSFIMRTIKESRGLALPNELGTSSANRR
jgi:Lrp/AsnC family transcriptional regulator, leucine-responsive regulatory protein